MVALKQRKSANPLTSHTTVIEITRSDLTLVCAEETGIDQPARIRWRRLTWRTSATSLFSEEGRQELTTALEKIVERENLQGRPVYLALSSDFCVTRVVSGENDVVTRELRGLAERSALYLSLGAGEKLLAESFRPIDAKRQAAWMTVTNRKTLDAVCQAAEDAGLVVDWVEHSMIALCRAVGGTGRDAESPVLIVDVSQRGIDLGISHQGRLLLDYRPGGMAAKERVAHTVLRHLKRLQRYCNRNFQFGDGKISRVYICGDPDEVPRVFAAFQQQQQLVAEILEPEMVNANWAVSGDSELPPHLSPALGLVLAAKVAPEDRATPNLVGTLLQSRRGPLIPDLIRHGWPIGAVVLVTVLLWCLNLAFDWQYARLAATQETLQAELATVQTTQLKIREADSKLRQAASVKRKLFNPPFQELMGTIGGCMPEGTWLVDLRVDRDGATFISGRSRQGSDIYEFVDYLKKAPNFQNVALEGTREDRVVDGKVTYFEVKCKYLAPNGSNERKAGNG